MVKQQHNMAVRLVVKTLQGTFNIDLKQQQKQNIQI